MMFKRIPTTQEGHDHDVCPECGSELCGGLIVETMKRWEPLGEDDTTTPRTEEEWVAYIKDAYSSLCYSEVIGIELPLDHPNHYDGVSFWKFPCCGAVYDRFTGERVPQALTG